MLVLVLHAHFLLILQNGQGEKPFAFQALSEWFLLYLETQAASLSVQSGLCLKRAFDRPSCVQCV